MTVDFELANCCIHKLQCTPCSWCFLVCWVNFLSLVHSSCVISALHCAQHWVFCSQLICASSVLNSRRVWTLSSACQCSSMLKWEIAFRILVFLCTLLRILHQMLDTLPRYQQNYMLSHPLTLLSSLNIVKLDSDLSLRLHLYSFLHL